MEAPFRQYPALARQRLLSGMGSASGAVTLAVCCGVFLFPGARPAATIRLRNFIEKAAQATLIGDVFDDAATGQGLLNFFLHGLNCGALSLEEAQETGLTRDELQGRCWLSPSAMRW